MLHLILSYTQINQVPQFLKRSGGSLHIVLDGIFRRCRLVVVVGIRLLSGGRRSGVLFLRGHRPSPLLPCVPVLLGQVLPRSGHRRNDVLALRFGNSPRHGQLDAGVVLLHVQRVARVLALRRAGLPLPLLRFGLAAPLLAGILGLAVFIERCELVGCQFLPVGKVR